MSLSVVRVAPENLIAGPRSDRWSRGHRGRSDHRGFCCRSRCCWKDWTRCSRNWRFRGHDWGRCERRGCCDWCVSAIAIAVVSISVALAVVTIVTIVSISPAVARRIRSWSGNRVGIGWDRHGIVSVVTIVATVAIITTVARRIRSWCWNRVRVGRDRHGSVSTISVVTIVPTVPVVPIVSIIPTVARGRGDRYGDRVGVGWDRIRCRGRGRHWFRCWGWLVSIAVPIIAVPIAITILKVSQVSSVLVSSDTVDQGRLEKEKKEVGVDFHCL